MNKKLFLLLLVCVFSLFAALPALSSTYELADIDGDGAEIFEEDDVDFFSGGNFYARYRLPKLSIVSYDEADTEKSSPSTVNVTFSTAWTVKAPDLKDIKLVMVSKDISGDFVILSGILPVVTEDTDYDLSFIAEVSEIEDSSLAVKSLDIEADAVTVGVFGELDDSGAELYKKVTNMSDYIAGDVSNIGSVTSSYSVAVTALGGKNYNYIASTAYESDFDIDLPKWLKYTATRETEEDMSEEDAENFVDENGDPQLPIKSVTLTFNNDYKGIFKDGSKGVVRIPFVNGENEADAVLEWAVELSEPFTISTTPKTVEFALTAGGDPVVKTVNYTGAAPVKYEAVSITGINFTVTSDDKAGIITVTAEATSAATAGTQEATLTFTDAKGRTDTLTVKTTVTVPKTPEITFDGTKVLTLIAGGDSVKTKITAGGSAEGKVTWAIGTVPAGLKIVITDSGDKFAEFTLSADNAATTGNKTVSITATDSKQLKGTVNLAVTVNAQQTQETQQAEDITSSITITDDTGAASAREPFSSVKPGESKKFTISLPSSITAKIWKLLINGIETQSVTVASSAIQTAADDWAKITSYNGTTATIEANVPSSLANDSAISMSVADTNGKEYNAVLGTVKASSASSKPLGSSGGGCDTGLGALALAIVAQLFICKKH